MTSSSDGDPDHAPVPPGWPGDDPTLPEEVDDPAAATPDAAEPPDEPAPTGSVGAGRPHEGRDEAPDRLRYGHSDPHEAPDRLRYGHSDPHETPDRLRYGHSDPHETPDRHRAGPTGADDGDQQRRRPGRARRRVGDDDGGYRPAHARSRRKAAAHSRPTGVGAPGLHGGDRGVGDDDDTGDLDVDPQHMGVAVVDPDTEPDDLAEPGDGPAPGDGPDDGNGDADVDTAELDDLVAGVQPAGRVLVIMVASLLLAMLINADDLVERAEQKQPGPARDRSLAIWHPVQDVSHALQLHRVRELAEWLVGDDDDDPAGDPRPSETGARGGPGGRDIDDERADGVASPDEDATPDDDTVPGDARDGDRGHRGPGDATGGDSDGTGQAETRVPRATGDAVRVPTADAPLRLWVGGDAMAEMFGRSLVTAAEDTGLVEGTLHYEMASGLTRPDYYDWPAALADDLDDHDPEVVVMIVGTNDGQGIVLDDGTPVPELSDPRWLPEYRRRVGALMDQLHADGRIVFWVGQPPMLDADYDARIDVVNQAYAAEAAARPWITFVDSTAALGDPAGAFADILPDPAGTPVDVRRDDGIHLTAEGGDRLAGHVFGIIATRVDLSGTAG